MTDDPFPMTPEDIAQNEATHQRSTNRYITLAQRTTYTNNYTLEANLLAQGMIDIIVILSSIYEEISQIATTINRTARNMPPNDKDNDT